MIWNGLTNTETDRHKRTDWKQQLLTNNCDNTRHWNQHPIEYSSTP